MVAAGALDDPLWWNGYRGYRRKSHRDLDSVGTQANANGYQLFHR